MRDWKGKFVTKSRRGEDAGQGHDRIACRMEDPTPDVSSGINKTIKMVVFFFLAH